MASDQCHPGLLGINGSRFRNRCRQRYDDACQCGRQRREPSKYFRASPCWCFSFRSSWVCSFAVRSSCCRSIAPAFQFHVSGRDPDCSPLRLPQCPGKYPVGRITAAYRCAGKYMLLVLSLNVMRVLEGMSFLVLLVCARGPVQLAMLMLAISLVGTGLACCSRK